jgi:hypothetical protein
MDKINLAAGISPLVAASRALQCKLRFSDRSKDSFQCLASFGSPDIKPAGIDCEYFNESK